jgi:hypothetical protein
MSLVDSDHIIPARRGRHGAHFFTKADASGALKPAMIYKYEHAGDDGWQCSCGRSNWAFTKVCPICHSPKEGTRKKIG